MTSTTIAPPKVRQTKMLIGGQWRESQGGKSFATINPVNETVIAQVPDGNAADVDAAVKAARTAFESGPWHTMDARDRGRLMNKLADLMESNLDELAGLETLDNGKPISDSKAADLPLAISSPVTPFLFAAITSATPAGNRSGWQARSSPGTFQS